jgi:2'-5' RNA ligase
MNAGLIKAFAVFFALVMSGCRLTGTNSEPSQAVDESIQVDPEVLATHKLDWTAKSHFVGMKVPYGPIDKIKKEVEAREGIILQSRGEAHITVITPPEMGVLRTRMSLEQINGTIAKSNIQATKIHLDCLGRGQWKQGHKILATYFLIVKAPGLLLIREKLRQQFVAAGGDRQAFVVERFRPHVTVGFTERDLHPEDGVIKDKRSCVYRVE